jgi:Rieske Fe-S protein
VALSTLGIAVWSVRAEPDPGEPQPIIALDQIPEGTSHLFTYPTADDPAILVHLPGGELLAYSQKCTHLGCVVYWEPEGTSLVCPCHEGFFDARTGEPTAGPPERPLGRIELEVRDTGMVWALSRHL